MKKETVQHSYTPISSDEDKGHVDFLIKVYFKNVHPKFPHGGRLSQHLYHLPIGSPVEMCGPRGKFDYLGNGNIKIDNGKGGFRKVHVDAFAMVSGGTGITPMMQIIRAIQRGRKHPTNPDKTKVFLVYGNQTEKDILLRKELDELVEKDGENVKVWYTIDRDASPSWKYSVGYVSEEMFREHLPIASDLKGDIKEVMGLMCGPPPMVQYAIKPNLEKIGYTADTLFSF
ncbi:cytochrome-b5 reductase [Angomonas deanei]|nr:cytochrome-b5 reductase [Angomonas deanei]EPY43419.1 cytochrome-b5 reductase [Angomonas deanei]|eukprot:EPY28135.1 cytochrome-b5 reductase [Angomonas deanei]